MIQNNFKDLQPGQCLYMQQFEDIPSTGMIVATHSMVKYRDPEEWGAKTLVVDENSHECIYRSRLIQTGNDS